MATIRPSRAAWRLFFLVGLTMVLASLNFSLIFVAFGDISESFNIDQASVSWALTAFSITLGALIIPGGWAADRYGRATVFLYGFAVFVVASGLVALAPSIEFLIVARVMQAAALAFESPAALAIVMHAFPVERRATAVGAIGGLGGISAALGPVVGGALVDSIGWRWTFSGNIPIGLLILAVIWPRLERARPDGHRGPPDLLGAVLIIGSTTALILGIVQSPEWDYFDARTIMTLFTAGTFGVLLVLRSRRQADPILKLDLYRIPTFRLGSILQVLVAGSFAGVFLGQIRFLDSGWGFSLFQAGLLVALIPTIAGPLTVVAGRIADRFGHRVVIVPGTILMAIAGAAFVIIIDENTNLVAFVAINVVYATGVGLAHAACQSTTVRDISVSELGIGAGMARIALEVGMALNVAAVVALIERASDPVAGFRNTMLYLLILCAAAVPLTLRLPRTSHIAHTDATRTRS